MAEVTLERVGQPALPDLDRQRGGLWRILREIGLLAVLFGVYNLGRFLSAEHAGSAFRHAHELIRWEARLGLPSEASIQHHAVAVDGLARVANVFYASVHFPLTAAVLLWLMIRRPAAYGRARWALASLTGLALIGHMFFPLAPPRMMPGWVDTGVLLGQSVYGPSTDSGVANQFAAMPSLHVGWALWCGVMLWRYGRTRTTKVAAVAYPLITTIVVMGTANHYFLDAVAGAAVMGAGFLLAPYVTRAAERATAGIRARIAPVTAVSLDAEPSIVSDGCQTSTGEHIPRQRESRFGSGAEPSTSPAEAGDGAAAAAR